MQEENKHWSQLTIEDFCSHRILEGIPEKRCQDCGDVSMFWVDDMGGTLCIECAHNFYADLLHDEYENLRELERLARL